MRLSAAAALLILACWRIPAPLNAQAPLLDSARTRLARLDGEVRVPGLDSTVEVRRDQWGVPHIYAKTTHDLFFAQGYVVAQDRLWQMEMWRRAGEGRLAEVLGPDFVERDRTARLLRYRGDMEAEWRSYAEDAHEIIRAFVGGVNARIAEVKDRPPIEFTMLGFAPEPWDETVPLQRMGALSMTSNALEEVERASLLKALGKARLEVLLPPDPWRPLDPAPGLDLTGIGTGSLGSAAVDATIPLHRIEGSNNWVVSGAKTATGKPLLANDPHRTVALPSLRYLTHLVGPGWNVIGAGEPGVPGVAGGHNERVGFGFTIVGMDQQDVYVEKVSVCPGFRRSKAARAGTAPRCALSGERWVPLQVIRDTIRVKGEAPRAVRLEFSRHGPIVSEDSARGRAFALRFVGSEPGTAGYLAQLTLDRAGNWDGFRKAAARWKLPTENLIYADVDGNIGWVAAGLMPIRSWSGLLPVPGTGSKYEWGGFLPFGELPSSYNPASGFVTTSNQNILPPGYTKPLNYDWADPYRHDRLVEVLRDSSGFTRRDFERLQHDELALPARILVPLLRAASQSSPGGALRTRPMEVALDSLLAWDWVMRREQTAPLIYEAWLGALYGKVLGLRLGPLAGTPDASMRITGVVAALSHPDSQFGRNPARARDSILLGSLDQAVAALTTRWGSDPAVWHWGDVHQASFKHPLAAAFDLAPVARGGDGNTVNATAGPDNRQTAGASYRIVIDFADFDNSTATNVPGQSGQPASEYYGNLLPLWGDGKYFPLLYSRAAVERGTTHTLWLTP